MSMIYVGHVREGLTELASRPIQQRRWLAAGGPEIGSFDEAVSQTFDDSGLGDVLEKPMAVDGLGAEAVRSLQDLSHALDLVDRTLGVEDLIDSQPMDDVRGRAATALNALPDSSPLYR